MTPAAALTHRRDCLLLAALSAVVSAAALAFCFYQNTLLLYGDAVAHINIARRVFDSRTPGLFQLGTVWLPPPHLLNIPFIFNDRMWQTGLGASLPSMIAYVAGMRGVFRLVQGLASRSAAWIGALIYAVNPNLFYMHATAMTESLYLALFIWAVVYFSEFTREAGQNAVQGRKSLEKCAMAVSAAMLVRYDGWFLAGVLAAAAMAVLLWQSHAAQPLRRGLINFILLTGLTGGLFLAYN